MPLILLGWYNCITVLFLLLNRIFNLLVFASVYKTNFQISQSIARSPICFQSTYTGPHLLDSANPIISFMTSIENCCWCPVLDPEIMLVDDHHNNCFTRLIVEHESSKCEACGPLSLYTARIKILAEAVDLGSWPGDHIKSMYKYQHLITPPVIHGQPKQSGSSQGSTAGKLHESSPTPEYSYWAVLYGLSALAKQSFEYTHILQVEGQLRWRQLSSRKVYRLVALSNDCKCST